MFSIRFLPRNQQATDGVAVGEIVVGRFREAFESPLGPWSQEDYRSQWEGAVRHIISGESPAALMTAFSDPDTSNFLVWWPLYRFGDTVRVQNHLLFMESLTPPFRAESMFEHVPSYAQVDEEGDRLSEWSTAVGDLATFLTQR